MSSHCVSLSYFWCFSAPPLHALVVWCFAAPSFIALRCASRGFGISRRPMYHCTACFAPCASRHRIMPNDIAMQLCEYQVKRRCCMSSDSDSESEAPRAKRKEPPLFQSSQKVSQREQLETFGFRPLQPSRSSTSAGCDRHHMHRYHHYHHHHCRHPLHVVHVGSSTVLDVIGFVGGQRSDGSVVQHHELPAMNLTDLCDVYESPQLQAVWVGFVYVRAFGLRLLHYALIAGHFLQYFRYFPKLANNFR